MSKLPNSSTPAPQAPNANIVNVTTYSANISSYKNHIGGSTSGGGGASTIIRDYRKGNWSVEETLVLITAKKLYDERRNANYSRTGELRWKWVENYCWANGCLRSQNQCNDKWDNLLRDYKKVREYHHQSPTLSYWSMDKAQRKDRNLPSNMLLNIYEALNAVVQKKNLPQRPLSFNQQPLAAAAVLPLPPPNPPPPPPPPPPYSEASESSETQGYEAEKVDTKIKRRRVRDDIGFSIVESTKLLSQTLKEYKEKKERHHRELMELEQKRLHLEETRNEVSRQGIAGLITSVNKLSDAIHALISEKRT